MYMLGRERLLLSSIERGCDNIRWPCCKLYLNPNGVEPVLYQPRYWNTIKTGQNHVQYRIIAAVHSQTYTYALQIENFNYRQILFYLLKTYW